MTHQMKINQILLDFEMGKTSRRNAMIFILAAEAQKEPIKKDVSFLATFWFLAVTGMGVWGLGIVYAFIWLLGVIKNVL